ncbi:MAG TPA: hypothetical protein VI643_04320 [Planctomycetota bacterium]|nr:hypothetical protein [Planctomycetota bacterium]
MVNLNRRNEEPERDPKSMSVAERLRAAGGGLGRSRGPGRETMRLVLVALVAFGALGALIFLQMSGPKSAAPDSRFDYAGPQKIPLHMTPEDDYRWDGYHTKFKDSVDEPDPAAEVDVNSEAYHYFVRKLRDISVEQVLRGIEKDGEDLLGRWEELRGGKPKSPARMLARMPWDYPAASRGKYFRLEGRLMKVYSLRVNVESEGLPKDVYMGVMEDRVSRKAVHFYIAEMPRRADGSKFPTIQVRAEDGRPYDLIDNVYVVVEGVFLNLRVYESVQSEAHKYIRQHGANLVAKRCTELPPPPPPPNIGMGLVAIMGVVAVIIGALVVFAAIMGRRYNLGSLRIRAAILKRERRAAGVSAAGGAAPDIEPKPEDWRSIVE